ncbi:unnamed protein product [Euphydryas editha]|uniref:Kazal-like domain-containing protein n=1 Tax=Euphydryas editha TaxID=104508 RepID=A0AAU9U8E6_EUPED|nr:unnamed protein product [Euphydryas editha]
MSLVEIASDSAMREERIQNIYKFCTPPHLIEFWTCMNQTIQEVVSGSSWWGRACCTLGHSSRCRHACATAADATALTEPCRRSDEIAFFDCVQRQQEAQWCCSQTQSLSCHEACQRAVWRVGQTRADSGARERAIEMCEQSPPLLHCMRELTGSTVHTDTSKYLPCCHESPSQECRSTCELVLRRTGESQEIAEALSQECGAPAIHDGMWQCFLRKDAPPETKDVIPHDVAKLHCCQKGATINCRRLCFNTFNNGWQLNWQKFYTECLGDPQETEMAECIEEVEAPCSLGCGGLTYCSQLNNRPTSLFRSCSSQADLDAHLAVAEQKGSGHVTVAGVQLPLKNSSQCTADVWKSVACALHVKPCTTKGHSSLLCTEDCKRLVSSCVEWSRAPLSAAALCARLAPRDPAAPCVSLRDFMSPSTEPPLLLALEQVTSPCAGSPCNATQVCVINRNCLLGGSCLRYSCVDGCPLGDGSTYVVPIGSWVRVPMPCASQKVCIKICRCGNRGLSHCQPLPNVALDNCRLHDKVVKHGEKYYMECNACVCVAGERVCARRACGRAALLTGLPCNCPPHHLPVHSPGRLYPNACLAKCAGATDAEIEFGSRGACAAGAACARRHACLPARSVCLSRLQAACPQHKCVNTTSCNTQPTNPVCDTDGHTHTNPCHLVMSGRKLAYWGQCLKGCSSSTTVCGVNGVTYSSECAAWAEYVSVDYIGPCYAVGPISDLMEPKCQFDRIICPPLKKRDCLGFTAPGACCPKCGGALRILYSKKQIDRALYGTNISATVINLHNVLSALDRHIKVAECALRGYLTIEMEIFVTVETILKNPTDLQLHVCVLEAEKLADLINRESALITSDLGLSALSYALTVHTHPTQGASSISLSIAIIFTYFSVLLLR